jgi:hypothetical protein
MLSTAQPTKLKITPVRVFVLSNVNQPLMPCLPARAKELLSQKKAYVHQRYPFTIKLIHRSSGVTQPTELCIDPGSKITGLAIICLFKRGWVCVWGANLHHRGYLISQALLSRKAIRRNRRSRHTRYRRCKWPDKLTPSNKRKLKKLRQLNYKPKKVKLRLLKPIRHQYPPLVYSSRIVYGRAKYAPKPTSGNRVLMPSLKSRVDNIRHWSNKLISLAPTNRLHVEIAKFDLQKLDNPEITGLEYQQGTLLEYEAMEYLLLKHDYTCSYCDAKQAKFTKDHIVPKASGGSNRISNLTLACHDCNDKKSNMLIQVFLAKDPIRLSSILAQAKKPLKDAAVMNSTRYVLALELQKLNLPIDEWTGGLTKYNRVRQAYPKDRTSHYVDAACIGLHASNTVYIPKGLQALQIKTIGRGNRQVQRTDSYGFPLLTNTGERCKPKKTKRLQGFQTGDIVSLNGHIARVETVINNTGYLRVKIANKTIDKPCSQFKLIRHTDGYSYSYTSREDLEALWSKVA